MSKTKWILTSVFAAILLLVPAVVLANELRTPVATVQAPATVQLNADTIFDLVNNERTQRGLKPLVRDVRLDTSAQIKADDMAVNNYFGHINPTTGVNGPTLIPVGMCSYKSENIIAGWPINTGVVSGWVNSELHRDAILDSRYTLAGVAVSGDKVVQHFCIAK
jgi:uncharacterized protein YkwD